MRCWELSHAVTAPRLVKHEPIATPCQPSSPPLSRWWCRCFPGCSGVVGWLSSSFHSVPHRLPVQPLSSVNWQLKRDLAALRLSSKHIIFSLRLSTLVVPGLLKKLLYAVILCYFVKKTLALVNPHKTSWNCSRSSPFVLWHFSYLSTTFSCLFRLLCLHAK